MEVQILDIIVRIAVGVGSALITGFLIPALIKWQSSIKDKRIFNYIKSVVNAAEQLYGPGTGKIKKEYVTEIVKKAFGKVLTDEQIDALIESAVFHISQEIKRVKTAYTEKNVNDKINSTENTPIIRQG